MESFFDRYKNPLVLMAVLFVQIIALATQVKRPLDPKAPRASETRLIRVWAVTAFTPVEHALISTGHFFRHGWNNYVDLHDARKQNQELQQEITRLRLEQVRMKEDAEQARRLQALLGFRERFIGQTMAAQVIGTSGTEQSRVIYIDRGSRDGIRIDMPVITPDGIVGKIKDVFPLSSQVLMINDRDSGAGVILENSRLQGVLRGTPSGELQVDGVMADQAVSVGEPIIASGGDRIYPKGFAVGNVSSVAPDRDTGTFLTIKIKPAADLNRLEEVLVVTKMAEQVPATAENGGPVRAADILAQRLPTVPPKTQQPPATTGAPGTVATGEKKKTASVTPPVSATAGGAQPSASPAIKPKKKPQAQPGETTTQKAVPQDQSENPPARENKTEEPSASQTPANSTEKPPE